MVAVDATGALMGTYYLKPNSLALGAHVANADYGVAEQPESPVDPELEALLPF
jgi:hypothetical protein